MALSVPLLAVQREPPPLRPGAVRRPRLVRRLRGNGSTRLTVVSAPAGWGKTTLLSQWVHDEAEQRPVAWVSPDESDNDATPFWTYVLTALEATGVGTQALAQLSAPGVDAVTAVSPRSRRTGGRSWLLLLRWPLLVCGGRPDPRCGTCS